MRKIPKTVELGTSLKLKVGNLGTGGAFICSSASELAHKKVFVRNVVPDELITALVEHEESNLLYAKLEEVIEPSPLRITPACKFFGECGGCNLQHVSLETQRNLKLSMLESMPLRHARIVPTAGFELVGQELPGQHYRRRVIFHVAEDGKIGFFQKGSGKLVEIDRCLIASVAINQTLELMRQKVSEAHKIIDGLILEEYNDTVHAVIRLREHIADFKSKHEYKSLMQAFPQLRYETTPAMPSKKSDGPPVGHFSQVNSEANKTLVQLVQDLCPKEHAITELYAGAGNFSFHLAPLVPYLTAVEMDPNLVRYGESQRAQKNIANLKFVCESAERFVRDNKLGKTILLDPPRQGAKHAVERFNAKDTSCIIYVSCDVPTLARDLKILTGKGFTVEKIYMVDMFPQTYHVETVSVVRGIHASL